MVQNPDPPTLPAVPAPRPRLRPSPSPRLLVDQHSALWADGDGCSHTPTPGPTLGDQRLPLGVSQSVSRGPGPGPVGPGCPAGVCPALGGAGHVPPVQESLEHRAWGCSLKLPPLTGHLTRHSDVAFGSRMWPVCFNSEVWVLLFPAGRLMLQLGPQLHPGVSRALCDSLRWGQSPCLTVQLRCPVTPYLFNADRVPRVLPPIGALVERPRDRAGNLGPALAGGTTRGTTSPGRPQHPGAAKGRHVLSRGWLDTVPQLTHCDADGADLDRKEVGVS